MRKRLAAFTCTSCLLLLQVHGHAWSQEPAPQAGQPAQSAAAAPPATEAAPSYGALVEKLRNGDRAIDFTRLRTAYTETPEYRAMMMGAYQQLWQPLGQGNFAEAIKTAEAVLERNYAEPNAHMVASLAYLRTGEASRAEFHRFVANGLLRSITSKGDGKTAATAYEVIDVSEEFALVRSLNLTPRSSGTSAPPGGPAIDSMHVVDPRTGTESTIFFNVDRVMQVGYQNAAKGR